MARPTKLSSEVEKRIVGAIKAGNYLEASARAAGISPSTLYRWLDRGEKEASGAYADFVAAVRLAEAEAEVHAVTLLRRAMPDDWRAALAYLERRYPGRWRRQQTTELTGKDGGPIRTERGSAAELDLRKLSDEELALLEQLHRRAEPE